MPGSFLSISHSRAASFFSALLILIRFGGEKIAALPVYARKYRNRLFLINQIVFKTLKNTPFWAAHVQKKYLKKLLAKTCK